MSSGQWQIYAFSGKMGSGKDFLAAALRSMLPAERNCVGLALADHFKVDAIAKDHLEFSKVYGEKDGHTRQCLQHRGTEEGREKYGEDIWAHTLTTWMNVHRARGADTFFVTDVRFPNELHWIRSLGQQDRNLTVKVIRVVAPERTRDRMLGEVGGSAEDFLRIANHVSETALDNVDASLFDAVIYNDPSHDAIGAIRNLAIEETQRVRYESVVFIDLDDTLCECGRYYDDAITSAGELLVASFPQYEGIASVYEKYFGAIGMSFEKDTFTRSKFADTLVEVGEATLTYFRARADAIDSITSELYRIGMFVHEEPFTPLPGAAEAVREIQRRVDRVVIFTVGERADQMRKLYGLGLQDLPCEAFIHKDFTLFRVLMDRWRARHYTMIGDSLTRDIKPALEAGIERVVHLTKLPLTKQHPNVIPVVSIADAVHLFDAQ